MTGVDAASELDESWHQMQSIDNQRLFGGVAIVGAERDAVKDGAEPESSENSSNSDEASFEEPVNDEDMQAANQVRQVSFEKPANDEAFAHHGARFQQNPNDFSLDQGQPNASAGKLQFLATPFGLNNNSLSRKEDGARMSADFNWNNEGMHDAVFMDQRNSVRPAAHFPALVEAPRTSTGNRETAFATLFGGGAALEEQQSSDDEMLEFDQSGLLNSHEGYSKEFGQVVAELKKAGQEHVIMYYAELSESARALLMS